MKVKNLLKTGGLEEREQNTPLLCLPKTYMGLEYEWESTGNFPYQTALLTGDPRAGMVSAVRSLFNHHVDGSLRDGGMEFTFKEPYAGTRILAAIDAMDDVSRAYGFTSSYRTSLHVHMDLSELNYPKDAHRFAALYAVVEPLLYKFVGANRDGCNYCIPWYANPHHYMQYARIIKPYKEYFKKNQEDEIGLSLGSHLLQNKNYHKYAGLNLLSMGQFGTAEFRHAPVNMQKEKILVWLNILMRIKKYVVENQWDVTHLMQRIKSHGAKAFIANIFGSEAPFLLKNSKNVEEDLKKGSLTMFHFISAIQ
jgi:Putative amidoligase enzyme